MKKSAVIALDKVPGLLNTGLGPRLWARFQEEMAAQGGADVFASPLSCSDADHRVPNVRQPSPPGSDETGARGKAPEGV